MTAISDYFRTALVIDDRVESDFRELEALDSNIAMDLPSEPDSELTPPPDEDETPVRPSSLVSAFLAENIVCSVFELEEHVDFVNLALRGAQIADLLILDWLLFGDHSATVNAIKAIAEESKGRLVVVAIFTGAHSLTDVATRLKDDADFEEIHDFVLRRDDAIVLVFGKPGIPLTGGEDSRTARRYSDLPQMVRDDLELVFKGLMPRFAFRGINVLRESAPKVLATFNSTLDAGALVHRALLTEPDDAGPQFLELLASEFKQTLMANRVDEEWDGQSVRDYLAESGLVSDPEALAHLLRSTEGCPNDLKSRDDSVIVQEAVASGLLRVGITKLRSKNMEPLVGAFGSDRRSDNALASLMCSTGFGSEPPRLELGVVVKDPSENYWLCIQPLCDSVRIQDKRAFPLMPLHKSTEDDKPDAIFQDRDGRFVSVNFEPHPHTLAMPEFEPNGEGSVIAEGEAPNWRFESRDASYQAVTRLRAEVASHAVHSFASTASRVGVDVSEWMSQGAPE